MNIQKFALSSVCAMSLGLTAAAQQPQRAPTQPDQSSQKTRVDDQNQTQQPNQRARGEQSSRDASIPLGNKELAECLALENQAEVILAKFGQEKSQNTEVKSFATMMVEDHQSFLGKLQQFAPDAAQIGSFKEINTSAIGSQSSQREVNRNSDQSGRERNNRKSGSVDQSPAATQNSQAGIDRHVDADRIAAHGQTGHSVNMMKLHQEVAQQCLADSKAYLTQKEGSEFDKCFLGMQLAKHAAMQSKLTVFQRHASGDFKQVVDQGLETTKKHLKHAEKLMEQLAGTTSEQGERRLQARQK